jgi:hypothetical protein
VEKSGTARQATEDNMAWWMSTALRITTAKDTHSEYEKFIAFPHQNVYANAPQYYVYTYIARPVYYSTGYKTASTLTLNVLVKKEC